MVIVTFIRLALSLGGDPLVVVALFLLGASALGAVMLMSDLLSNKHRDRLSITAVRQLAWGVAFLAAAALLLLALRL
jgi:hypothetical protein